MKKGKFDFLHKPLSLDQVKHLVFRANLLEISEDPIFKEFVEPYPTHSGLVGNSECLVSLRNTIDKIAKSIAGVYISGESGTGKELVAKLIHEKSGRTGLFVPVNCGAIPETLMESEFFGYKKGSFTGAVSDREGVFHVASGGTLFLDEIADLPLTMQVKLLRAIQEKKVRRVGGSTEENVDIRVVSASHKNLKEMVENGQFRQDLFYRLNVIEVKTPPLREHPEDIPAIISYILKGKMGSEQKVSLESMKEICAYPFPGNVRELENMLERAVAFAGEKKILEKNDFLLDQEEKQEPIMENNLESYLAKLEIEAILEALIRCEGNKGNTAAMLGITPRSLRYRMLRLGMEKE